jgi:carboxymethylenebutenolidase
MKMKRENRSAQLDAKKNLAILSSQLIFTRKEKNVTGKWLRRFLLGRRTCQPACRKCSRLNGAVAFYGAQPAAEDVPKIKAPLLLHYGGLG